MMMHCLILFLLLFGFSATTTFAESLFAVAVTPAPVLNRPDFSTVFGGKDGRTLLKDDCGQLRTVEFVALPGTVFTIEQKFEWRSGVVYRVTSADYPYPSASGYFVDGRSVKIVRQRPAERARILPGKETILAALQKRAGSRYIWGGNVASGVAALSDWYPPAGRVDMALWQLAGVDCSGILYEATGGYTPRNTSSLAEFGRPVSIAGKTAEQIAAQLQPLDLIVWPGHVLILLDGGKVIESRLVCKKPSEGVRIRASKDALAEIMHQRKAVDSIISGTGEFVVRRWYGETEDSD
jgi:cell wall-associated NlpC family hydrolase